MWLWTGWKLKRALRRYGRDREMEALLRADWRSDRDLAAFFADVEERLHGEEITKTWPCQPLPCRAPAQSVHKQGFPLPC